MISIPNIWEHIKWQPNHQQVTVTCSNFMGYSENLTTAPSQEENPDPTPVYLTMWHKGILTGWPVVAHLNWIIPQLSWVNWNWYQNDLTRIHINTSLCEARVWKRKSWEQRPGDRVGEVHLIQVIWRSRTMDPPSSGYILTFVRMGDDNPPGRDFIKWGIPKSQFQYQNGLIYINFGWCWSNFGWTHPEAWWPWIRHGSRPAELPELPGFGTRL